MPPLHLGRDIFGNRISRMDLLTDVRSWVCYLVLRGVFFVFSCFRAEFTPDISVLRETPAGAPIALKHQTPCFGAEIGVSGGVTGRD